MNILPNSLMKKSKVFHYKFLVKYKLQYSSKSKGKKKKGSTVEFVFKEEILYFINYVHTFI